MSEKENDKKIEIREKGLELFRKQGFDRVTVNAIAEAAGISKNTFYYYYKSKEEIILSVFRPEEKLREEVFLELMRIQSPYQQLMYLYEEMIIRYEKLGKEIVKKAVMINYAQNFSEIDSKEKHKIPPLYKLTYEVYERAQKQGEIRDDIEIVELMKTCLALMLGELQIWVTAPKKMNLKENFLKKIEYVIKK
ncbi:MAG: TetR/AcrR family transcriptional regulator [Solobacterium sp.]|nr:TetR/AcrR family transcriptional regulator [Solobacterium sp.]